VKAVTTANVYGTSHGEFDHHTTLPTSEPSNNAMEMGPRVDLSDGITAPPVYAVVPDTRSSDQSEASAPAEGSSPPPRVTSLYLDTTLIENDLYG